MVSADSGTGCSRIELEESHPGRGLTSLEVGGELSYEGLKNNCHIEQIIILGIPRNFLDPVIPSDS